MFYSRESESDPCLAQVSSYCWSCVARKVARSKHCSVRLLVCCSCISIYLHSVQVCDRCVHVFDHHCPWMGNCIGRENHRTFVTFLLLMTGMQVTVTSSDI